MLRPQTGEALVGDKTVQRGDRRVDEFAHGTSSLLGVKLIAFDTSTEGDRRHGSPACWSPNSQIV